MDVGIRELKEHLSEFLERAAKGESIVVTDRGKPKAMLGPVSSARLNLEKGIAEGWIRPGKGDPRVFPRRPFKSKLRVSQVLAEDRDED